MSAEPTALEAQREDQRLGAAWRRCEAALPERRKLVLESIPEWIAGPDMYTAEVAKGGPARVGRTPALALEALATLLESAQPSGEAGVR